jgi:uncharacterized protein Usg
MREKGRLTLPDQTGAPKVSADFLKQLAGWGLTTAEILYRLPDHPKILQSYIWQDYDLAPEYPTLRRFLKFWTETLEGPLFSVRVGHALLIRPTEVRTLQLEMQLH